MSSWKSDCRVQDTGPHYSHHLSDVLYFVTDCGEINDLQTSTVE